MASEKAAKTLDSQSVEALTTQVESLHKQLMKVRLEEVLGKEVVHTMTDPQAAARKKLMVQLDQLKTTEKTDKKKNNIINVDNTKDKFEYELFLKPETSKFQQEVKSSSPQCPSSSSIMSFLFSL